MKINENKRTPEIIPNISNDSEETGLVCAPTNIPNNDIFSSYIFASSNRCLSKYGERLLMEVISVAQEYTIDQALGIRKLNFIEKYKEKFANIDIPIRKLLNADDATNYTAAKKAALELMKIYHYVETPKVDDDGNPLTYDDGKPQYQLALFHLLDNVTVNVKPGIVSVKLGVDTWSQILDMGKGYTRYNLITAKRLDDVVAIRLFQLMSNTSRPLTFSIDRLKGILGLKDKYVNNVAGFLVRVIVPAEKEIKEKCPFMITHELTYERKDKKGRPSVSAITFTKVAKPSAIKKEIYTLPPELSAMLIREFGFNESDLRRNSDLFKNLVDKGIDVASRALKLRERARSATNPPAYIIRCLQNDLEKGLKDVKDGGVQEVNQSIEKSSVKSPKRKISGHQRLFVEKTGYGYEQSGMEEL